MYSKKEVRANATVDAKNNLPGKDDPNFRIIIVGKDNGDPYEESQAAIDALGAHYGLTLDRRRCFPYAR